MKIIFNSDMLHSRRLIKEKLTNRVSDFVKKCKDQGHEIIIPLTTLYEFNNMQKNEVENERNIILGAAKTLANYGITTSPFDVFDLVKPPDLLGILRASGVNCRVEEPSKIDFDNAHRKACLKEDPHPPNSKKDEMRDLVIWELALRLARDHNGAIFLGRDEVFTHHRGDKEAAPCGLIRFDDLDRASEALDLETTSAKVIKVILQKVWAQIILSELPINEGAHILKIKQPLFKNYENGTTSVIAEVSMNTGEGKILNSILKMNYVKDQPFLVEFSQVRIDDQEVKSTSLKFDMLLSFENEYKEKMKSLRDLIGG